MCSLDKILTALADNRRRTTLYYLQEHQTLPLPDVAELVAEREHEATVAELSGEEVKRIYLSLYHTHVPRLVDAALAHYEQEDDLVAATENTASVVERVCEDLQPLRRD
ncbi:DUF7344 domain-containing protein [Haloarcula nitratireducens]|uniref:DUF7344 domain-containing protein n=1 Tax=Haloarcula nitratireducens TaxID=2487749 RepID=UPI003CCBAE32